MERTQTIRTLPYQVHSLCVPQGGAGSNLGSFYGRFITYMVGILDTVNF